MSAAMWWLAVGAPLAAYTAGLLTGLRVGARRRQVWQQRLRRERERVRAWRQVLTSVMGTTRASEDLAFRRGFGVGRNIGVREGQQFAAERREHGL